MVQRNARSQARGGREEEGIHGSQAREAVPPEDAPVCRLAVGGGELQVLDRPDGRVGIQFERDGKLLLSWTAPAIPPPAPPKPPKVEPVAPPPTPVQPILLPVPERSTGEKLLRAQEVADRLGLSKTTVYRMAAEGAIPSARIGFSRRFRW